MTLYPGQDAFTRGEISPRLHARASLDLYKGGLALCENFITLPHGGLRKRGGTRFVGEVIDSERRTRVIRRIVSEDQAYALVLGHQQMRVYAYGARVGTIEIATPWTEDEIWDVQYFSSADDVWLMHPNYETRKLSRLSHLSWSMASVRPEDGPFEPRNTDDALTLYATAATGTTQITASADVFDSSMEGRLIRIDMQSYEGIPPWEPNSVIAQPTVNTRRRYDGKVYETPTVYNDANHEVRTGTIPPTHTEGTEWDGTNAEQPIPDATGQAIKDIYHGLQWTYLHSGYGVARIENVVSSTVVDVTVLTLFPNEVVGSGNPSNNWRLGAFDIGTFPASGTIFEERVAYGQRYSVYASKSFDFESFETGEKADDALAFYLAGGGEANEIAWLEDIDGFLTIGTIGGVRSLSGSGLDEALTPSSFKNRNSRALPCAKVQPVRAGQNYLYVVRGRKKIAELTQSQQLRFQSEDIGQISEHIPKKGVVELAFQDSPDPLLWVPLDDGQLGCFTYQPSQEVRGWHRHPLGGSFDGGDWGVVESACVTPGETGEDDVWLIVKRTINGITKRFIEIITPSFEYGDIEDAFQVDCGLTYEGAATTEVSNMEHLAGETVDVLAGGKVYRGLTVTNAGHVSLPDGSAAATPWHVGLPTVAAAETLELDIGGRDGSLMGRRKKVTEVIISLFETDVTGLQISSKQKGRWESVKIPSVAPASETASLFTGNVRVPIDDSWEGQGKISIRHVNPTPCTIRAMTPAFDNEP